MNTMLKRQLFLNNISNEFNKSTEQLFLILSSIKQTYNDKIKTKLSAEHTRSLCFARDNLLLFNDEFRAKPKEKQNIDVINKFKSDSIIINHSEKINILKSSHLDKSLYLVEFNPSNKDLYSVLKKYINETIDINLFNDVDEKRIDTFITLDLNIDMDEILFDSKYLPNELERVKEQSYNFIVNNNNNYTFLKLLSIKNKIEHSNSPELNDVFIKVAKMMNIDFLKIKNEHQNNNLQIKGKL